MATIKPRRGTTAPTTGLVQHELAVDTTNKRIYIGNAGGSGDLIGSAPGGSDTQVQFNDGGNLGGDSGLTYNKTTDTLTSGSISTTGLEVKTVGGDEGGQIDFGLAATNTTLNSGVAIDIFQNRLRMFEKGGTSRGVYIDLTSASAGVGTNLLASSASPGGSDTYVQFNDGGSAFGGDAGLTYNKTTDSLTITGDLAVNGGDITTSTTTATIFNSTATTLSIGGATSSTINIGATGGTSTIDLNSNILREVELRSYFETKATPTYTGGMTQSLTVDLSAGNVFVYTTTGSISTINPTNIPSKANIAVGFTLVLTCGNSLYSVNFDTFGTGSPIWAGGTPPTSTNTVNNSDVVSFVTYNGGTTWYGFVGGLNFS